MFSRLAQDCLSCDACPEVRAGRAVVGRFAGMGQFHQPEIALALTPQSVGLLDNLQTFAFERSFDLGE